jgi:hypothetical protein
MGTTFGIKRHVATVALVPLLLLASTIQASGSTNEGDVAGNEMMNGAEPAPAGNDAQTSGSRDADNWTVAIYPVLGWAPIFGASVSFPNAPSIPGSGESITGSGTTNTSFNGAALAGVSFQKQKWTVDFDVLWAGLSADRTTPRVYISAHVIYGDLLAGREIYHHLALTGGVRRMALNIHTQLGDLPEAHWKPGVWDPLVGLDWRQALSHKWAARLDLAGGGVGVGNDVDLSAASRVDWRFARHFGLTMGYGALHFQNSTTVLNQVRKTKQTLHGPIFGFGIYLGSGGTS